MGALACFGFLFLSLWLCALVFSWLNALIGIASREGRGCAHRALLLLPPLLFYSSLSFGSSSISGFAGNGPCVGSFAAACAQYPGVVGTNGLGSPDCEYPTDANYTYNIITCSEDCIPSSGEPIGTIGTSLTPNSNGVVPGTYCSPTTYCDSYSFSSSAGSGGDMTNGIACFPSSPTSSTSSSSNCPSGYSPADASGCICTNGSGSFTDSNNSDTNPSCNGGSSTAPVLSPVSPVTSNGQQSCPSGAASVSSGTSISCYQPVVPPAVNPLATPGGSGGGSGGGSSYHLAAPTKSSNGQLTCPPGASSIGNGSSLECIVSGPAPISAPTGSGTSGTSPTGSTASGYPTSFSMPSLPSVGVTSSAISSLYSPTLGTVQSCPSPVTFSVMNHTFSISFQYACSMAAIVRPIIIGVFTFASVIFVLK
ncbi:MAG: virulence factor TspB C-terminal domain-related protein [Acidithiobacillus sp.]